MVRKSRVFIEATPLTNSRMSGIGHVVLQTARALDDDKYADEFDIRLFVPWDEKKSMAKYTFKNIRVVRLPLPHKFFGLFSRFSIAPPLDIFLGKGVYIFPNFRNWNLLFSKSLTYIHDVCFSIFPEYVEPKNGRYLKKYMPMWLRRTDGIVAISDSSKAEIEKYLEVKADDISVVMNAVDRSFYYPRNPSEVVDIRDKYGLDRYFLYLGNIEPRKNLENLVRAFSETDLKDGVSLFLVGGDGWLNESIYQAIDEARARGYNIKKNKQYVPDDDIPALMSGAEALIQPSWHEGFGLAVLQALACGTEVIAADIPGLKDAARRNENYVSFFNPSDKQKLKELIIKKFSSSQKVEADLLDWSDSVESLVDAIRRVSKRG